MNDERDDLIERLQREKEAAIVRNTHYVQTLAQRDATIKAQLELVAERNMISEILMEDAKALLGCVLASHDAHSFWSEVREVHALLDKEQSCSTTGEVK